MDLKKILLAMLAKQHNISEEQAAELLYQKSEDGEGVDDTKLKDNVLKDLLKKDKERVETIRKDVDTSKFVTEGYNKGRKETLEKEEKRLAKKHGIDESLKGDELIAAITAKSVEAAGADFKVTEETIKKHPIYLELENSHKTEVEQLKTAHETALSDLEKGQAAAMTLGTVKELGLSHFDGLGAVLSKDPVKAANQRKSFGELYGQYDYEKIKGSDDYLIMKKDGTRLEDGHGNAQTLAALTAEMAGKFYDFAEQTGKESSGNSGGAGGTIVGVPKSQDEFETAYLNASTDEEKDKLAEAYEASKGESS